MEDDLKDAIIITPRDLNKQVKKLEPVVDEVISRIVGFKVYQLDPRIIKLVVKFRKEKLQRKLDSDEPDNFLENPTFIKELKEVLNKSL